MASDEVLRELVDICLQLGHVDEAKRIHAGMKPSAIRNVVGAKLARRGLLSGHPARGRAAATRASAATFGPTDDPTIHEHVADALQFLCQAHMPIVALMTMLAFPLIVGLGGFLTAGGSPWLFAGLAAIPGLCVLGVVGAMGRSIFLEAADGSGEIPPVPPPGQMVRLARRHLGDAMLVLGALVAPSLTLIWFEAPLVSSLPGLVLGMFLSPIALILRMLRGDLGALSPVAMIRGIGCCAGYTRVAGAFWLAFAPAAIAFWTTLGHAIWLQLAIIGPLVVLPTFATMRLLGTFTEVHRERLGLLLQPSGKATAARPRPAVAAAVSAPAVRAPSAAAGAPNLPPRPSNISRKAQNTTPQPSPLHKRPWGRQAPPAARRAPPAARHIEGRAPAPRPAEPATKQLPPARMPLEPNPIQFDGPDLSNIPGARVISGEDRERFGASSRRE